MKKHKVKINIEFDFSIRNDMKLKKDSLDDLKKDLKSLIMDESCFYQEDKDWMKDIMPSNFKIQIKNENI